MSSEYVNDPLCVGCSNPACRYGGCQGRYSDKPLTAEEIYTRNMARRMLEYELDPKNFFKMPRG